MAASVYCLGCGEAFDGNRDPYPLANGMCPTCVREMRRPNYLLVEENETLRRQVASVVRWLKANGFPFDWQSVEPAPRFLREPIARAWSEAADEPVENYLWSVDQEQTWA